MSLVVPVPPPNHVRVRFVSNPQLMSKLIRWWIVGAWSHAEVVVDVARGGTIVAAQTAWIEGQPDPGVQNYKIDYDYWSDRQLFFDARLTPIQYKDFVDGLFSDVGKPFDHLDFTGIVLHDLSIHEKQAMICSQLVIKWLINCGFEGRRLDVPEWGITPQSLYLILCGDPRWVQLGDK